MSARIMDRPEEAWHGASVTQLQELRARALEGGCSEAMANGLVGWLISGDVESATKDTRARYRRVLRELGPPQTSPPGRRNARRRRDGREGQRGAAEIRSLAAASGGVISAAVCAAAGRPVLALVVAPIIPEGSAEVPTAGQEELAVAA